jgi:glycosyltransferase involved in cell wall biosynthesis
MYKLLYLVSHPIQYQAPLLRRIAQERDIELTVLFRSDLSVKGSFDDGFKKYVKWDIDLLNGYKSKFLKHIGSANILSFWRPINFGLYSEIKSGEYNGIWVHGHGSFYHLYALLLGRLLGLQVLLRDEVHLESRPRPRSRFDEVLSSAYFSIVKKLVDVYLAVGSKNKKYYTHRGVSAEKIVMMPYAVDNVRFGIKGDDAKKVAKERLLKSIGIEGNRTVIGFISKLSKRKRCSDLVNAFCALPLGSIQPRPLLIIVGDGEELPSLQKRVSALARTEDVVFFGFRGQLELPTIYHGCDVFVLPSAGEPWGLVINEAMNGGCAIIAAKEIGASADLVQEGQNGFTFPAGNSESLRAALKKVLSSPDLIQKYSLRSRQIIQQWGFEEDVAGLRKAIGLGYSESLIRT